MIGIHGNHVAWFLHPMIITFPVKHNWWAKAELILIERSCKELLESCKNLPAGSIVDKVYMVRPGCGNGQLLWDDVKPILESYLDNRFVVVEKYR